MNTNFDAAVTAILRRALSSEWRDRMNPLHEPDEQYVPHPTRHELRGRRRDLHERLVDVCEEFAAGQLTKEHKRAALVGELRYLLDYYQDEASWEGVE